MEKTRQLAGMLLQKITPRAQRLLFAALFALCLSVLSATSYAACVPRPGCSCDVWQAQSNHADANRVRDKGYARQTVKQNDNTLGMTCFDHALALSSRLGQMFSDKYPEGSFAPADTKAFGGAVYDSSSGVGQNAATGKNKALGSNYGYVLNDELKKHADDFTDSMSSFLGATFLGFLDQFSSMFDSLSGAINSAISTIDGLFNDLASAIDTIQSILDLIGGALPAAVPAFVAMVQSYWDMIKSTINSAVSAAQSAVTSAVKAITDQVMGALGSLLGAFNSPEQGECSRIQQLWNPSTGGIIGSIGAALESATGVDGFRPMTGGGIEHGTPYFDFSKLVNKAITGAGKDLMKEINNSTNSPILSAALADISSGGVLNTFKKPEAGVFWTQPENLNGMSVKDMIEKM